MGGEVGRAMAVVYLYSSKIKELDEMGINTAWVQRILNEMAILDTHNLEPYIDACLTIKAESGKGHAKGLTDGLMKYLPICECVEDHFIEHVIETGQYAA